MKRLLRWTATGFGILLGLAIIAYAVLYVLSEQARRNSYEIRAVAVSVPTDPASIAEGRRLATLRGCLGCHDKRGEGRVLFDRPMIARIVAPNLTDSVRRYSDAELAVIIRNGVRPDGESLVVMPSEAFAGLTDEDLGRIIAFLKSLPALAGPGPDVSLGPLGRIGIVAGKFKTAPRRIAETVPPPKAADTEAARGRYLAATICAECHGTSLGGDSNPDFRSPSLRVVAAYSPQAFAQLLRTGVPLGGRTLVVMGETARENLSPLTDAEIAALYRYLHDLPATIAN